MSDPIHDLCHLLHLALVEARILGEEGRSEQVVDLANAFHDLPRQIPEWTDEHAASLRESLQAYQTKWTGKLRFDYLGLLAKPGDETHPGSA